MDKSRLAQEKNGRPHPEMAEMPEKPRKTRARDPIAREKRSNKIVDAASRIFAQLGYAATEMDRVALELGLSKGTLYLYFENKEALFLACVDKGMTEWTKAVRQAMETATDPFEKIMRAFRAYLLFFEEHPYRIELLIQERANFKDRTTQTYFEHRANNRAFWKEIYQGLIDSGRVTVEMPLDHFLDLVGNLLYGTMFTKRYWGRSITIEQQTSNLLEFVFQGVIAPKDQKIWKTVLKRMNEAEAAKGLVPKKTG